MIITSTHLVFTPVCLFVCEQNISKCWGRIWTKFGGELGYVPRTKLLDFGEDPNPDLDPRIFKVILHFLEIGPNVHSLVRQLPNHTHICRLTPPTRTPSQNNMATILVFWEAWHIRPAGLCWLHTVWLCCIRFPLASFGWSVNHD